MDEGQRTHRRLCGQTTEHCFPGRGFGGGWGGDVGLSRRTPPQHPISTPQINGLQPHDLAVDRKGRKLRDNNGKKKPQLYFTLIQSAVPTRQVACWESALHVPIKAEDEILISARRLADFAPRVNASHHGARLLRRRHNGLVQSAGSESSTKPPSRSRTATDGLG